LRDSICSDHFGAPRFTPPVSQDVTQAQHSRSGTIFTSVMFFLIPTILNFSFLTGSDLSCGAAIGLLPRRSCLFVLSIRRFLLTSVPLDRTPMKSPCSPAGRACHSRAPGLLLFMSFLCLFMMMPRLSLMISPGSPRRGGFFLIFRVRDKFFFWWFVVIFHPYGPT